jgi:hypothetical protein
MKILKKSTDFLTLITISLIVTIGSISNASMLPTEEDKLNDRWGKICSKNPWKESFACAFCDENMYSLRTKEKKLLCDEIKKDILSKENERIKITGVNEEKFKP